MEIVLRGTEIAVAWSLTPDFQWLVISVLPRLNLLRDWFRTVLAS